MLYLGDLDGWCGRSVSNCRECAAGKTYSAVVLG